VIGHGGVPSDFPKDLLGELKALEARRNAKGGLWPEGREKELDDKVRRWPRTAATDPYKSGLEAVREALAARLPGRRVTEAYNEFCGPSVEEAVASLAAEGVERVTLVSTMFTRGGVHSEKEIPDLVRALRDRFPRLELVYAWPFPLDAVAGFLAAQAEGATRS
jgi:sirohydrochlorin cobaltochelatase